MTTAQLTFWWIAAGGSIGLTALFYPGVVKHAASGRDAMLAAAMAAVLCATSAALATSAIVNAVTVMVR